MTFRERVALSLSPLLLRLAIGVTFVWFGWGKFQETTFTGQDAAQLIELGIGTSAGGANVTTPAEGNGDADNANADESSTGEQPGEGDDAAAGDGGAAAGEGETAAAIDPNLEVTARGFNGITLLLHRNNHPYPRLFAMIAAITELAGGALVILGLFTRIWSLGLAIAMGYAFFFTSLGLLGGWAAFGPQWITNLKAMAFPDQTRLFFQLVLLAGSLSLFFGSAGSISADRILFRSGSEDDEDDD